MLLSVTDSRAWNGFVAKQPGAQFTQSWDWGEFRVSRGHRVERLALTDEKGKWIAAASFAFHGKPVLGGFWYAQRGPVIRHDLLPKAKEVLARFVDELEARGLPRSALFWRIEPAVERKQEDHPLSPAFVRARAYQPAATSLLELTKTEDELLARMHEKTRYNVRLAERKGVRVRAGVSPEDVEIFLKLNEETAARDRFTSQSQAYIRSTVAFLAPKGMARVRIAELGGLPLAADIEVAYGDTATYLYGASSNANRNAMAPFALHWDAIRAAKAEGRHFYDFYGINPIDENSPAYKPSWEGITRFKLGWGGSRVEYVGTYELPMRPVAYKIVRRVVG
jgi:peptidoglycan pentaglycine glycine transferase (the first glycine)